MVPALYKSRTCCLPERAGACMTRATLLRHLMVGFVLAASLLSSPGCCLVRRSSDATLAKNLVLSLRVSTGYYSENISFELFYSSVDKMIWPGGRKIIVTANGRPLASPTSWSLFQRFGDVYPETRLGYRRRSLWHMSPTRLAAWLGGPGRYSIQVSIGPVNSNSVVVECLSDGRVEIIEAGRNLQGV